MMQRRWRVFNFVASASLLLLAGCEEHGNPFKGDVGNAIWTMVIFGAVVIVLGKFAWSPILTSLQKREDFIRDALQQAKQDRDEAEKRLAEYTQRINSARAEATAIVEEGRRDADALKRKLEEDAKAEAQAIMDRSRREISIATETATKQLYTLTAKLATEAASRIIRKELTAKDHERLISESVAELEKVGS